MNDLARRIVPAVRRRVHLARRWAAAQTNRGYCPICDKSTFFTIDGPYLRDNYHCWHCGSIPRWRALLHVLQEQFPNWRELSIHESSPGGPASDKLSRECRGYLPSHYYPKVPLGSVVDGFRCEDLCAQTFHDHRFDLVITSDVFEHIPSPRKAFVEIARTLKPGGAHLFTVPWYPRRSTLTRARLENGNFVHLEKPEYHGNPIDAKGSLVVTDWGYELPFWIQEWSGLATTVFHLRDRSLGIDGTMTEVFVSRKMPTRNLASDEMMQAPGVIARAHPNQ